MKKLFLTLAFLLTSMGTVLAERPNPPADCKVKDPKLVQVRMHGAYVIEVSSTLNCHNRNEFEKLSADTHKDFWVAPGETFRIEAETGVGSNTTNQFLVEHIDDDYQVDCGGAMGSTNKCDWHKGPATGK